MSMTSPTASCARWRCPPPRTRTSTSRPAASSASPRSPAWCGRYATGTPPTSSSSTCPASRWTCSGAGPRSKKPSACSAGRPRSSWRTGCGTPPTGCASTPRWPDEALPVNPCSPMSARRALITGITGQDGSHLADLLLDKGYEVHGMVRRSSTEKFERIEHLRDRITLHQGDLLDQRSLVDTLRAARPDEIYNLAAMSFVAVSWIQPTLTAEFTGVGVTRLLEAMREACPEARFYQASSSEMFGKVREVPQTETTPFHPRSPYGVAKVYGHFITANYRASYGLHATSGVLFNHESVFSNTPLLVREDGVVAVKTPVDLVSLIPKGPSSQTFTPSSILEVWDGERWTGVRAVTATRLRKSDTNHSPISIHARGGIVDVTSHHNMLDASFDKITA